MFFTQKNKVIFFKKSSMCSLPPFCYFLKLRTLNTSVAPEPVSEAHGSFNYYEHLANLSSNRHRIRSATRTTFLATTVWGEGCNLFFETFLMRLNIQKYCYLECINYKYDTFVSFSNEYSSNSKYKILLHLTQIIVSN